MRRIVSTFLVVVAFAGILFAQGVTMRRGIQPSQLQEDTLGKEQSPSKAKPAGQKRKVDYMADLVKPYNSDSDSVIYFLGNFAAHHNGAVIWCDSAVRYSDTRWGFFSRVVINQDSIYIYGDSAIYDGDAAHAEIYAPIVKVVDGDALLYTYNFSFNTESRVGQFTDGGVLVHDDNILESVRGYYDANEHNIICVERVELHGADYDMKSDSVIYNTQTEFAQFFSSSEIWNVDGEYLAADEGYYDRAQDLYMVTRNGYLLSKEQEVWGDTLEYHRSKEHIVARSNIQMDDIKNKVMAFGDFAEYWQAEGNALLTRRASAIGYDTSQSDTVFMSADTVWLLTIDPKKEREREQQQNDELYAKMMSSPHLMAKMAEEAQVGQFAATSQGAQGAQGAQGTQNRMSAGELSAAVSSGMSTSEIAAAMGGANQNTPQNRISPRGAVANKSNAQNDTSISGEASDSVVVAPINEDSLRLADSIAKLPAKERAAYEKAQAKLEAKRQKEVEKREQAILKKAKLDSIAMVRQAKINKQLDAAREKELKRIAEDSVRRAERRAKLVAKGKDVTALDREDSIAMARNARVRGEMARDSVKSDSVVVDSLKSSQRLQDKAGEKKVVNKDSAYRLVKAYRNVKMFRSDAQMICDSLVSNSQDSIIRLYIEPVMWNQANQLTAEQVDVYTSNRELQKAEFMGDPIMIAEVDTVYYNQVAGKTMTALFKENAIYRNDVEGNVQTIYFRTETEDSPLVVEMTYLESASASFFIEDQQLVGITYRNEVPFKMYPLALIPASQPTRLEKFKWVPEMRPTRDAVFDRVLRPTEREERGNRRRPTFSIVERMDRHKERLIMSGEWSDREDQLTPELIEWRDKNMQK